MGKTRRQIARKNAVIGIYQYLVLGKSLADVNEIKEFILDDQELLQDEEACQFAIALFETTLNNLSQYCGEIARHLKKGWTIDRLSKFELAILNVAACEILELETDKRIAINEAVLLTKEYCDEGAYKFINGILHSIL